jgi:hypothetical protein
VSRFQARRGNGRWQRNTMENTFGLHVDVCESCRAFVSYSISEAPPDACHRCGEIIIRERCTHGRCRDRFPDPFLYQAGAYKECDKLAVAADARTREGQCSEHVNEPEPAALVAKDPTQ